MLRLDFWGLSLARALFQLQYLHGLEYWYIYIERLLHKMENQDITVRNCTYYTKSEFLRLFHKILSITCETYTLWWRKKTSFPSLPVATDLPSAAVGLLSLPSVTANLHIIHKTFTLSYSCVDKSKYKIHTGYRVII